MRSPAAHRFALPAARQRRRPLLAAGLAITAFAASDGAAANESVACGTDLNTREIGIRVEDLPGPLATLGLHEDFILFRAESRVTAAGWTPRPPRAGACRRVAVAVQLADTAATAPAAVVEIRLIGLPGGGAIQVAAEGARPVAATETVPLESGASLAARRATIDRVLDAVARQVDAALASSVEREDGDALAAEYAAN